ncbi:MAG: hypothetical protein GOP50_13035 [Candidatus Heimdallarchaeota archaeon]|nr:hypothetical protein [Candidatus Heimdallarchaeota archaeon]
MSKIGYTTSRDPAKKTRSFIHDIIAVVPRSKRVVRGSASLKYGLTSMKNQGVETAIIVNSVKGNPNFVRFYDLSAKITELPYAIKIRGVTLFRDYNKENKKKTRPSFSIMISTLNNPKEEEILKKFLGISNASIEEIEKKNYVTVYADYLDKDEGIIFIEFLDKENSQVGPRIKLRIVDRKVEETLI